MIILFKTTLKLLFRNKGFWFFMLLAPTLSILMLSLKVADNTLYTADTYKTEVTTLEDVTDKVAYYNNGIGMLVIKVYDASGSDLAGYFLDSLSKNGMFKLLRADAKGMDDEAFRERLKTDGYDDRMNAAVFIKENFDEEMRNKHSENAFEIDLLSDDGRNALFETEAKNISKKILSAYDTVRITSDTSLSADTDAVLTVLNRMDGNLPAKEIVSVSDTTKRKLTQKQSKQKTLIGYVFAFLTLGFVLCGTMVSHTVISEQKEQVLVRVKLANVGNVTYFLAKYLAGVVISFMMTFILAAGTLFISEEKIGMSHLQLILLTFLLGLIFCSISLLFGVIFKDIMSANVTAFTVWSLSSMLSGLFFPLDSATSMIKIISSVLPQKYFLDGAEMIFVGDNMVYIMLLCITAAYIALVASLGGLGIKLKKAEA
jgi:ABC-type multidrug transport system permease subunit